MCQDLKPVIKKPNVLTSLGSPNISRAKNFCEDKGRVYVRRLPGTKASLCERSAKGVRFSLSVPPWLGQEEVGRILAPLGWGTGGGVGQGRGCWRSHLSAVPACAALHPLPLLVPLGDTSHPLGHFPFPQSHSQIQASICDLWCPISLTTGI